MTVSLRKPVSLVKRTTPNADTQVRSYPRPAGSVDLTRR